MSFDSLEALNQHLQFALKNALTMEMMKIKSISNFHISATMTLDTFKV